MEVNMGFHFGAAELILLLALICVLMFLLWAASPFIRRHNVALRLAKERYAKGEISDAEFMKIKKNIS
jgi:uncharacterized membrane protein